MRIGDLIVTLAVNKGIGLITRDEAIDTLAAACGYTRYGADIQLREWRTAQSRYRDKQVPNPAALAA